MIKLVKLYNDVLNEFIEDGNYKLPDVLYHGTNNGTPLQSSRNIFLTPRPDVAYAYARRDIMYSNLKPRVFAYKPLFKPDRLEQLFSRDPDEIKMDLRDLNHKYCDAAFIKNYNDGIDIFDLYVVFGPKKSLQLLREVKRIPKYAGSVK